MITPENILRHELIGLETRIVKSDNLQVVDLHGKIVDETKSMFVVKTRTGIKKMPKETSIWKFNLDDTFAIVNGKTISKRPHERMGVKA
jgi:ribonuclease P protein subunit POP4